jgi:hypothetical protein
MAKMIDDLTRRREAVEDFERRIAKGQIRFAVCNSQGKHSGVWCAWGQNSEYYIGAHSVLGTIKVSLHSSGCCRIARTKQHMKLLADQGLAPPRREFVEWRRAATPESGAVHVVSVLFPLDYLHLDAPVGTPRRPLIVFGASQLGHAVEFGFFYSRTPEAEMAAKFSRIGKPLFRTSLNNGDSVSIVTRVVEFDSSILPRPEVLNAAGLGEINHDALPEPGATESNLTATFWNSPKDGESLRLIEIGGVSIQRGKD